MLVYGVPRDPCPLGLSFKSIVMDNLDYATHFFDSYVAWFVAASTGPIMGDVLMSKGQVLGGITRTQVASGE